MRPSWPVRRPTSKTRRGRNGSRGSLAGPAAAARPVWRRWLRFRASRNSPARTVPALTRGHGLRAAGRDQRFRPRPIQAWETVIESSVGMQSPKPASESLDRPDNPNPGCRRIIETLMPPSQIQPPCTLAARGWSARCMSAPLGGVKCGPAVALERCYGVRGDKPRPERGEGEIAAPVTAVHGREGPAPRPRLTGATSGPARVLMPADASRGESIRRPLAHRPRSRPILRPGNTNRRRHG